MKSQVALVVKKKKNNNNKKNTCQCRRHKRYEFDSWVENIPWSTKWKPTTVFLLEESHGQSRLEVYSPWGCKELNTAERLSTHINEIKCELR